MTERDILEEAVNVAAKAEMEAEARTFEQYLEQFAAMLATTPDCQFIFLVAGPVDEEHTIFRQISNSTPHGVAWMLNLAGHELMRRYSENTDFQTE